MEPVYSPRACYPNGPRAALSHEITQPGSSFNPDPAHHFGRYSVAEHRAMPTFDNVYLGQPFRHTGFPGWVRPMAPVHQCCSAKIVCAEDSADQPTPGQQESPNEPSVDSDSVTSATESCSTMPLPEESGPDGEDQNYKKKRNTRKQFHKWQRSMLEAYFQSNNYISEEERAQLANTLGISEKQVRTWFQNRRLKQSKERKKILYHGALPHAGGLNNLVVKPLQAETRKMFRLIGGDGREIVNAIAETPLEALYAMSQGIRAFDAPPLCHPMQESHNKFFAPESTQVTSTLAGGGLQPSAEADRTTPPHSDRTTPPHSDRTTPPHLDRTTPPHSESDAQLPT